MKKIVVAIDGPAASGKSSTAAWVATELGFSHVDSGSLYRAATSVALRTGQPMSAWTAASVLSAARRVGLRREGNSFLPADGDEDLGEQIREAAVTAGVSLVAQMPEVREWVNAQVRVAAAEHDVVADGRDMGTAVFPDADLKIFLVADPWERARRRLIQRLGRRATDEEIAEETERIVRRDAADSTQTVQARDAILIDTTTLTQAEQVERIVALARTISTRRPLTPPFGGLRAEDG
ncbi:MAG: (d)CMP kinase [Gemmatimonadota bacterium]